MNSTNLTSDALRPRSTIKSKGLMCLPESIVNAGMLVSSMGANQATHSSPHGSSAHKLAVYKPMSAIADAAQAHTNPPQWAFTPCGTITELQNGHPVEN